MINREWIRAALIRAIRTAAQTAIATIGAAATLGEVSWPIVTSASGLAAILALLTAMAGLPEVDKAEYDCAPNLDLDDDLRDDEELEDNDELQ